MGNVHLVTGYAGKAHVTAADHGSLFEGAIRSGQFVLNAGAKFAATIVSNNEIKLSDGEGVMQGRYFKVDLGSTVSVTIENGTQGQLRNDLIVGRYTKDAETGVENIDFIALKGTPVESDPADPEYVSGNINVEGALINDILMYRVPLDGLNIGELVPLFEVWAPVSGVDPTLTKSGYAADAKEVGDAMETLGTEVIPITRGGTGATNAADARSNLEVPQWINHNTVSSTIAEGATVKLTSSIIGRTVFANINYKRAVGYVVGADGNKTITFSTTGVDTGTTLDIANFKVSDDGLTLTALIVRKIQINNSGSITISSPSIQFGAVYSIG